MQPVSVGEKSNDFPKIEWRKEFFMMPGLTTHILDLTHGLPAAHVTINLFYKEDLSSEWKKIKTAKTNTDGRLDEPLVKQNMMPGFYKMEFNVGEYFRAKPFRFRNRLFWKSFPFNLGLQMEMHIIIFRSSFLHGDTKSIAEVNDIEIIEFIFH